MLIAQDDRRVRVFRRNDQGGWRKSPDVYCDGQRFELPTLSSSIEVSEVHDGILDKSGPSLLR